MENDSDLHPVNLAVKYENEKCLALLLSHGFSPNVITSKSDTALRMAIMNRRLDICKILLEMQVAVDWNRPEIVQYLLEQGTDPDARDSDGILVIGAAVSGGHISMVQWLVDANADVNVVYHDTKLTPLHEACAHPEIVRLLLEHGASINKGNEDSRTVLNFAIVANNLATVEHELLGFTDSDTAGYIDVVEKMLEDGVDVKNVNEQGEPLLADAIKYNAPSGMIRKILGYNPNLEMRDKKENTALHCITGLTTLETVRLVVKAGRRLDVLNADKDTPLIVAVGAQMDDVFFCMLEKDPSLLTQNFTASQQRTTPLHEACRFGSLAMVRTLIGHGMDVNSCCEGIYGTPLISTTLRGNLLSSALASDIIALLLVNGANPGKKAGLFRYPLISACLSCPADTIKLLLNTDNSPQDEDSLNRKAVHLACYNSLAVLNVLEAPDSDFALEGEFSNSDVISFLLKYGADPTIKGHGVDRDWTVSEVAYYHHADFVEDLIDQPSDKKIRSRKRGSAPGSQDNKNAYCDNCLIESHGIFFDCSQCFDFSLCFKCYRSAEKIHPLHASFVRCGSEWVEDEVAKDEDVQEISLEDGIREQDVLLDLEEIPYEDFDSEVSE
ncbi:ankyrin 1 [Fusarium pseudocircinatum]|uniref:Ankyrin 1 n=1 Tax=Fusarium pseudocircinatum TaxID=56676 RepID=A0A8H5KZS0_9HYPO|nr:ankyrin 1 [Fusarium pseudocircinatum]